MRNYSYFHLKLKCNQVKNVLTLCKILFCIKIGTLSLFPIFLLCFQCSDLLTIFDVTPLEFPSLF